MSLASRFREMAEYLDSRFAIPRITDVFLPPLDDSGQPTEAEFMALFLESGATGLSFVMIPAQDAAAYRALQPRSLIGKDPREFALAFGGDDPVAQMLGMASINAISQHVMKEIGLQQDTVTDSLGLLMIEAGDSVGMVGLFSGLVATIQATGADLIIIEKDERLIEENHELPITSDATQLATCNKVLCTGTTVLNNTLDEVLGHCSPDAFVSVVGPTVGYFPDPLFASGVDVVGGRVVTDSEAFLQRLIQQERFKGTTQKTCFQKETYPGIEALTSA